MRKGRPAPRGRLAAAGRDPVILVIAAATAVGLALRLWQLSRPGYLFGVTEYDDGPYFGSAVRLVDGALPYRDFILVQPPGITLLMVPAALAGKVAGTAWPCTRIAWPVRWKAGPSCQYSLLSACP